MSPVTLTGRTIALVPTSLEHVPALWAAAEETRAFTYFPRALGSEAQLAAFVREALALREQGSFAPFTVVHRASGAPIGMSCYLDVEPAHRRLEIGFTWLARAHQRTAANSEGKLLLLGRAFDVLRCQRVAFKTDARNTASREALRRLGAREEGTFRRHYDMPDGSVRDSVWFSILAEEWPRVRAGLEARLARHAGGA